MRKVSSTSVCIIIILGMWMKNQISADNMDASKCNCFSDVDEHSNFHDVECYCTGSNLLDIPHSLDCNMTRLTLVDLQYFTYFEAGVFRNLNKLNTIYISHAPNLKNIGDGVFDVSLPKLKVLRIIHTGLEKIPNFNSMKTNSTYPLIDLENNHIKGIPKAGIRIQADQLLLNFNDITTVEEKAFYGSTIGKLSFKGNRHLHELHPLAFTGMENLHYIDLSKTAITELPTKGLENIEILKLEDIVELKVFPSIYTFQNIQEAWLTYPYHCCAFQFPSAHNPQEFLRHETFIRQVQDICERNLSNALFHSTLTQRSLLQWHSLNSTSSFEHNSLWRTDDEFFGATVIPNQIISAFCGNVSRNFRQVKCSPMPDAFNPCEDLMGNWLLRISVWFISLTAITGNLLVIIILVTSPFRLTVSKYLMVNLAIADLCIGTHLFLIAVMDGCSLGVYFNYAIFWQQGGGCKSAGFLTVFGNVLSVYTLAVITVERWYSITWAIHLNKRLKLRTTVRVMMSGWTCALLMAIMPLFNISGYSKTSLCLPLQMHTRTDIIYLSTLFAINAVGFGIICVCYASMYKSIRNNNQFSPVTSFRSDLTVAKRMALLVFTDFLCWAPIAFFGLTAILGYPLINVTKTKILLVFIYPLNSCANPCLYALLTQQYRRDFFLFIGKYGLCKEKAQLHKGAIGGVPLPYGSRTQYLRTGSSTNESLIRQANYKRSNGHRESVQTTIFSLELPVIKSNSQFEHECIKSVSKNNVHYREDIAADIISTGNL